MPDPGAHEYTFGDTDLAAERLRRLAIAFEPSTRNFLESLRYRTPARIADLGCGPGQTSNLLADVFPQAQIQGLDSSAHFISLARKSSRGNVFYQTADVTRALPGGPFDLIYARYLLTHLSNYQEAVLLWGNSITPDGAIAIEENEWIETGQPAFRQYLAIVQAMLESRGQKLYVGAELAHLTDWTSLTITVSEIIPVEVGDRIAADLFIPNLQTWRTQPFIQRHYDAHRIDSLESDLQHLALQGDSGSSVVFGRRRLLLTRSGEAANVQVSQVK